MPPENILNSRSHQDCISLSLDSQKKADRIVIFMPYVLHYLILKQIILSDNGISFNARKNPPLISLFQYMKKKRIDITSLKFVFCDISKRTNQNLYTDIGKQVLPWSNLCL